MNKKQEELCDSFYDETSIDLAYLMSGNNGSIPEDIDELMDYLQDRVHEIEVIYYHNAIDILKEHDPSLQESLGLAHDMGYTVDALNSELLATLLEQDRVSQVVGEYRDELEETFFTE